MTAPPSPSSGPSVPAPGSGVAHRLLLPVSCVAILLDALDLSITQVALPAIQNSLDVRAGLTPWIVNAYVLCYGGLLLLGGRLTDRFGSRAVFLAGMSLFGFGSLAAGLTPEAELLIAARALQGFGAAITVPAAIAAIAASYPEGPPRARALGVFAAFAAAGFSVGLVLGGVLTESLGWRWIFLVKAPVVVVVLVLAVRSLPPARDSDPPALRILAAGLVTSCLLLTAYCVTTLGANGPGPSVAVAGGLAVLTGVIFLRTELTSGSPLVPRALLRNRTVLSAQLTSLTVLATPFAYAFVVTQYLAETGDYSALRIGMALLPGAAASAVVSRLVAPRLLDLVPMRTAGALSLTVIAAGLCVLLRTGSAPDYLAVVLPSTLVVLGLGMGLAYPVFNVAALAGVAESDHGAAAGIQNTALQIGGGLGLAVVSAVLTNALRSGDWAEAVRISAIAAAAIPLVGAALFLVLAPSGRVTTPSEDMEGTTT